MGSQHTRLRSWIAAAALVLAAVVISALASATSAASPNSYVVTNLVSDEPGVAATLDPKLVNPWGLAALQTSPWWVADNGTDVSTLYQGNGTKVPLEVSIPGGGPTGLVANAGASFVVTNGMTSGPARFIFDTEGGSILGWNPAVNLNQAIEVVNRPGSIYLGLAIGSTPSGDRLYAADFHNAHVDVFDGSFNLITPPGDFVDPKLPDGYAPFGIANLGAQIFVAYAKQDEDHEEEVAGQGRGFVSRFDLDGNFIGRVASHGQLNAPWGLARASLSFGPFSGDLLVGNFGDGEINAYRQQPDGSYERVGALRGPDHKPIVIDGLWALDFGKGEATGPNGSRDTLFFTAGPDGETHGLFGSIRVAG
jgi:uncharacterized protein (TIGR03118 family)